MANIGNEGQSNYLSTTFNTFKTYSWINNSLFYPLVPPQYYDYYQRFVRQWLYWYDGFEPDFHKQYGGIVSSRIAYTVCSGLADLINGGTLMYDNTYPLSDYKVNYKRGNELNALEFIQKWAQDVDISNKNTTAISYSLAGGDSLIKLNSDGTNLYPTILRKDNYFVDTDFTGKVIGFTGAVYTYSKLRQPRGTENNKRQDLYYILEDREYDDEGNPKFRIYVKVGYGNLTTNKDINFDQIQEIKWEELPKDVRKVVKSNYGDIKLDEWYDIPLKTLGVYLMKASDTVSFMPQMPFGESISSNQIANYQAYDYLQSLTNTEMYLSRGRVLIPEPMQSPQQQGQGNQYSGLDSGYYQLIKYLDPAQQKPEAIQFELRADQIDKIEKKILRDIAMNLKISERTLANFLNDGSERATAREISIDDKTSTTVENFRSLYRKPLNCMLDDVLYFYNFEEDEITIRFSRVGLNNMNEVVQQMVTLKQNYLITIRDALPYIYVDKNEKQLDDMATELEKLEKEARKSSNEVKTQGTSDDDG